MGNEYDNGNDLQLFRFHLSQPAGWSVEHSPFHPPLESGPPPNPGSVTEFHLTAHCHDHEQASPDDWLDWAASVG